MESAIFCFFRGSAEFLVRVNFYGTSKSTAADRNVRPTRLSRILACRSGWLSAKLIGTTEVVPFHNSSPEFQDFKIDGGGQECPPHTDIYFLVVELLCNNFLQLGSCPRHAAMLLFVL